MGTVRTIKPGEPGYPKSWTGDRQQQTGTPATQRQEAPHELGEFHAELRSSRMTIVSCFGGDEERASRHIRVFMAHLVDNPDLQKCTPASYAGAVISAAQLGLEVGPLDECFISPRNVNDRASGQWQTVAVFGIGYAGLMELLYRNPEVLTVKADAVRKHDTFEHGSGSDEFLRHSFDPSADRGEIVAFYAYAKLKGAFVYEVLSLSEVERIRDTYARKKDYKSGEPAELKGAWKEELEAMGEKTALKRLTKWLRKRGDQNMALVARLDGAVRSGETIDEETGEVL